MFLRQESPTTKLLTTSPTPSPTFSLTRTGSLPLSILPPAPDPNLRLDLNTVPQLTTCTPATFSWSYSGPPGILQLIITNQDAQLPLTSPSISEPITFTADPLKQSYTWPQVDIPPGSFVLRALMASTKTLRTSAPFNIVNGTDVTCFLGDSFPSPLPPSPSPSPSLVAAASSSHPVNGGIIAGTVFAALIVLAIAAVVVLHNYRRRRAIRTRSSSKFWTILSSKPYLPPSPTNPRSTRTHAPNSASPSERFADLPSPISPRNNTRPNVRLSEPFADLHSSRPFSTDGHISTANNISPNASDEDITVAAPSEEKFSVHDNTTDPELGSLSHRSYSQYSHRRRSSVSSNRSYNNNNTRNVSFDAPTSPPPVRRRSTDYRASHPPSSLPPIATTSPIEHAHGAEMVRTPSTASSIRRATRKPVPQYDIADLENERSTSTHVNGNAPARDLDAESFVGKLTDFHKKPVHYLIPDLPPPSPRR